jgi:hypothetical protein
LSINLLNPTQSAAKIVASFLVGFSSFIIMHLNRLYFDNLY